MAVRPSVPLAKLVTQLATDDTRATELQPLMGVVPDMKSTVPVTGVTEPLTVAVRVVAWPEVAGLVEEVRVVAVELA